MTIIYLSHLETSFRADCWAKLPSFPLYLYRFINFTETGDDIFKHISVESWRVHGPASCVDVSSYQWRHCRSHSHHNEEGAVHNHIVPLLRQAICLPVSINDNNLFA